MSARSWDRTRAARSSDRSPVSRNSHGPTISARPATPSTPATTTSRATPTWPDWPVCRANSTRAESSRPTPATSRTQAAVPPAPATARTKSMRPVLSTHRSRCASSACRHSTASPTTPSSTGQNTTEPPKTVCASTTTPMPTAASATSGPTSSRRRPRPGRLPWRVAASRPGERSSRWVSVGSTSQSAAVHHDPETAESARRSGTPRARRSCRRPGAARDRRPPRRAAGRRWTGTPGAGGAAVRPGGRCAVQGRRCSSWLNRHTGDGPGP